MIALLKEKKGYVVCPICKTANVSVLGLDRRIAETTVFFSCHNKEHLHGGFSVAYLKGSVGYIKKKNGLDEYGKDSRPIV